MDWGRTGRIVETTATSLTRLHHFPELDAKWQAFIHPLDKQLSPLAGFDELDFAAGFTITHGASDSDSSRQEASSSSSSTSSSLGGSNNSSPTDNVPSTSDSVPNASCSNLQSNSQQSATRGSVTEAFIKPGGKFSQPQVLAGWDDYDHLDFLDKCTITVPYGGDSGSSSSSTDDGLSTSDCGSKASCSNLQSNSQQSADRGTVTEAFNKPGGRFTQPQVLAGWDDFDHFDFLDKCTITVPYAGDGGSSSSVTDDISSTSDCGPNASCSNLQSSSKQSADRGTVTEAFIKPDRKFTQPQVLAGWDDFDHLDFLDKCTITVPYAGDSRSSSSGTDNISSTSDCGPKASCSNKSSSSTQSCDEGAFTSGSNSTVPYSGSQDTHSPAAGSQPVNSGLNASQDSLQQPDAEHMLAAHLSAEVRARLELQMSWHPLKKLREACVLMICAGEDNEAVYCWEFVNNSGLRTTTVLAFESPDDAFRYADLLEASTNQSHQVCSWPAARLMSFCNKSDYVCRLELEGSQLTPPEYQLLISGWERQMRRREAKNKMPLKNSDLDALKARLEALLPKSDLDALKARLEGLIQKSDLDHMRARLEALIQELGPSPDDL